MSVPSDHYLRIIVCGGRGFTDKEFVYRILDESEAKANRQLFIIEGGQRLKDDQGNIIGGADYLAWRWAVDRGRPCLTFHANWTKHKKAAGPMRNQQMIAEGNPAGVISLPGGSGTADMTKRAKAARLHVKEVRP